MHHIGCAVEPNKVAQVGDLQDEVQMAMQARRRMPRATVVLIMSLAVCQALCCCQVLTTCFWALVYIARFSIYLGDGPLSLESVATLFKFPFKEFLPLILMS